MEYPSTSLRENWLTQEATKPWSPSSWRKCSILQQPEYSDEAKLQKALDKVHALPPLVHPKEVDSLTQQLAAACEGKMFLLQGGDCAERFLDCAKEPIENKFKIMLQMSLIILWGSRIPVIRLARMAGQFAKPRSSPFEMVDGKKLPSFKGDNINSFDPSARDPDPDRLVQAYFHSAATLNYIRAMIAGGVSDLHSMGKWNLSHIKDELVKKEYENVIDKINDGLDFLKSINADQSESLKAVDLYTSHEGLLLNYEEALTELAKDKYYNLGAHFLWIGDRTRQLDGAHIEYFRGISNPIGVKIGPTTKETELVDLVTLLNPHKIPGRLTLITRYGHNKLKECLPKHLKAVKKTGIPVLWVCDPCHGNTEVTAEGIKTRNFLNMMSELRQAFEVHQAAGSHLGGVHLELTGDDVTECVGGSGKLQEQHLCTNYETFCDPRLNYTQSLDIAFAISHQLSTGNKLNLEVTSVAHGFSPRQQKNTNE
jgi:3-deoxy-7-phosphoheptulonate synthase